MSCAYAEANPWPKASGEADNHFVPLSLYLAEGFGHHRDDPSDGSVFVRRTLQANGLIFSRAARRRAEDGR